jgi:uncharacterized protein
MNVKEVIQKFYYAKSRTYKYLMTHSRVVADKALECAKRVSDQSPDMKFIEEAALLHDIGIFKVHALKIGCIGPMQYVEHGYLGRELLDGLGYQKHALVCERHVGCGISVEDIENFGLPLPKRDMIPLTLEEEIICYADKFFTKHPAKLAEEQPIVIVRKRIGMYGEAQMKRFNEWHDRFGG